MCCLCLLEIYMTLVLEILSAITNVLYQARLLLACLYAGSADEDGGHQGVVTFGVRAWLNGGRRLMHGHLRVT